MLESSLIINYRRDSNILQDSFATPLFKAFQGQNRLRRWIYARQANVGMSLILGKLMFRKRLVFYGDDPAPRLTRLLLAFSLSYLLCVALGSVEEALIVRAFVEIKRHKPRHGTTRTLSVLSIGILRLSLKKFSKRADRDLLKMLRRLSRGKGVIQWCLSPPKPVRLSSKW